MRRRADGFALILVIWALVLLATVATGFAAAVRHETRSAGDLASLARAEAIAAAAVRHAALALASTDPDFRWQADAQLREIPWPDARVEVRVRSENARIEERYSLSEDGNTLSAVITVHDPANYLRPPVRRRQWVRNDMLLGSRGSNCRISLAQSRRPARILAISMK